MDSTNGIKKKIVIFFIEWIITWIKPNVMILKINQNQQWISLEYFQKTTNRAAMINTSIVKFIDIKQVNICRTFDWILSSIEFYSHPITQWKNIHGTFEFS